ncbi:MAG: UDP-glucose 4-epimerase GalE [bacterium]|nr:UDP-glucose 4-epimerase GalE [bacterium]
MILIAGGAGYIGAHTNKILTQKGYKTVVFDNLSLGHKEFVKWGHLVTGDLADIQQIRSCFSKYSIEAVMHFSAFANVSESVMDPAEYYVNNVSNTINLLNIMKEYGVKYIIFSSTCATYGDPEEIPMTENHPQNPVNPYGRSKLMIEQILKDYDQAYGIKHINLRYFNAAGADPDKEIGENHFPESHLIPLIIQAALAQRKEIKIFGTDYQTKDGTCIRDYVHVNDLASAHILALEYIKKKSNMSTSFNLGNNKGYSVKEVITAVERISGVKVNSVNAPGRNGDPVELIGSYQKAKEQLGWFPEFNLDQIIKTAWDWHVSNIDSWKNKKH